MVQVANPQPQKQIARWPARMSHSFVCRTRPRTLFSDFCPFRGKLPLISHCLAFALGKLVATISRYEWTNPSFLASVDNEATSLRYRGIQWNGLKGKQNPQLLPFTVASRHLGPTHASVEIISISWDVLYTHTPSRSVDKGSWQVSLHPTKCEAVMPQHIKPPIAWSPWKLCRYVLWCVPQAVINFLPCCNEFGSPWTLVRKRYKPYRLGLFQPHLSSISNSPFSSIP